MEVEISLSPIKNFPEPIGQYELMWSFILDRIFAQVYRDKVAKLHLILPSASLENNIDDRTPYVNTSQDLQGEVIAFLGRERNYLKSFEKYYTLDFGLMAPRHLQKLNRKPDRTLNYTTELALYGPKVFLYGLNMRRFNFMSRPAKHDRNVFKMRKVFNQPRPPLCYCYLNKWSVDIN